MKEEVFRRAPRAAAHVRARVLAVLLVAVTAAGCSDDKPSGPNVGTLIGTVTSSLGGAIAGVQVTVTPTGGQPLTAVTTDGSGHYTVTSVPKGGGSVTVSDVPSGCEVPVAASYSGIARGDSVTANVQVTCRALVGSVIGTVTSSLGGALSGVSVVVTPQGGTALAAVATDTGGHYMVNNVPAGDGSVAITGVPSNCTAPTPASYTALADSGSKTVDITATCAPTTGSLTIDITGASGITANVQVSGPSSFTRTLTATTTIADLEPGSYTVTAPTITTTGPIVTSVDTAVISNSPVTVSVGDTASTSVAYRAQRGGSGAMWIVNGNNSKISQFLPSQLEATGTPTAAVTVATDLAPIGMAVDAAGNIWVANFAASTVTAYSPSQLAAGGAPTAAVTLSGSALNAPNGIAFDAAGNLWVSNRLGNTVVEYTAAQLVEGGNITPTVTLSSTTFVSPAGLAFDAQGNLWVANFNGYTVAELQASQLAVTATVTPAVILSGTSIIGPMGLAFDTSGTLWVSNVGGSANTVVSFTSAQRAATGTPTATTTLTIPGMFPQPFALTFDNSGNLWMPNALRNTIYEYTAAQLATGGALTPTVILSGSAIDGPTALVFDPHPTGLVLH
jgi:sugar lactone lactonase YvrE